MLAITEYERGVFMKVRTLRLIVLSLLGSLLSFSSIATLFGVSIDEKLNKNYYKSRDETLFKK